MKVSKTKMISNVCILTMGLLVGSVLTDDQVNRKVCPREEPSIALTLNSEATKCFRKQSIQQQQMVREATTPEEIRAAFKQVCAQRPTYTACLAAVKTDTNLCLEGVERIKLLLVLGLQQTQFDVECEQRGEISAVIEQEERKYSSLFPSSPKIMFNCTWTALYKAREGMTANSHMVNDHMTYQYRIVVAVVECLEKHRGGEQDTLVNAAVAQYADLLDRMMCWDEQEKKEVLCKTIINII